MIKRNWLVIAAIILLFLLWNRIKDALTKARNRSKFNALPIPGDLPKAAPDYRRMAASLYSYIAGWGTEDEEIEALLSHLTDNELIAVGNAFNELLLEKGESECGTIVNWLRDDGVEKWASKFERLGFKAVEIPWWRRWRC